MSEPTVLVVRNEVDPDAEYHEEALLAQFDSPVVARYPDGDTPSLDGVDAVVLTGSTAGVYEADDHPWMDDEMALVEELVDREIPTLAVCFGHQLVNAALGGTVEHVGTNATLVDVEFADDPLFDGVDPVVPAVHGDAVTEAGDDLDVAVSAEHCEVFGTRHREAPLWTVQFHPEFTVAQRDRLERDFGWSDGDHAFEGVDVTRVYENFLRLAADR
ncbi:type 1 glutamine amidotransferase [Haloarchaeobius baliensis]|uniref:type 1 glutamine amidotransferase n=1 Tax=Haloarchaeobius baliensis TaxID=1670458 RepID=UPI003F880E67